MTTPHIEKTINKIVEVGKQRADWFEPSAEVILATTAKEQMRKAHQAGLDEERERCVTKLGGYLLREKGSLTNAGTVRKEAEDILQDKK